MAPKRLKYLREHCIMSDKYRLVTRSDFDGLVCAVLLRSRGMIDTIDFVHPKDVQDGKVIRVRQDSVYHWKMI